MKNPLHLRAEGFEFGAGKEADRTGAPAHDLGRELSLHNLRAIKKPNHEWFGFFEFGAGKEARTPDPNLGKVVLYQLSYSRISHLKMASPRGFEPLLPP